MRSRWFRPWTFLLFFVFALVLFVVVWISLHSRKSIDIDQVDEFNRGSSAHIGLLSYPPDWLPLSLFDRLPSEMQRGVSTPIGFSLSVERDEHLEDAAEIIEFERLSRLTMTGPKLTKASLDHLEQMPSLRKLDLFETTFNDDDLKQLTSLPYLLELRISQADKVTGHLFEHLNELEFLEKVCLECPIDPEAAWDYAVQNPKLGLYYANYTDKPFVLKDQHLAKLTEPVQWQGFGVDRMELTEKYLDNLKYCPAFRYQYFSGRPQPDDDSEQSELMRTICEVDLSGADITDGTVYFLAREPGVTKLDISSTPISDRSIASLIKSPSKEMLESLNLRATQITPEAARRLHEFPSLQKLDLAQTAVDDSVLESLKLSASLVELDVTDTAVTPEKIIELKTALPGLEVRRDDETN